eukprot:scaffold265837_cov46-Prasinocladus_malaysianus.AAC.1
MATNQRLPEIAEYDLRNQSITPGGPLEPHGRESFSGGDSMRCNCDPDSRVPSAAGQQNPPDDGLSCRAAWACRGRRQRTAA